MATLPRRTLLLTLALMLGLVVPGVAAGAQGPAPAGPVATEFPPETPVVDAWYGKSVAIDGTYFVVGAPWDDRVIGNTTHYGVGSVWLYTEGDAAWTGTQFWPPYWQDGDDSSLYFGESVDVDGERFVVGAPRHNTAWAYDKVGDDWTPTELAPEATAVAQFGGAVAVSGNRVVVGAHGTGYDGNTGTPGPGSLHLFEYSGGSWTEGELAISGAALGDQVGLGNSSLAIDGDVVVAGVSQGVPYGEWFGPGRVHVYTKNGAGWDEQVIAPAGLSVNDAFGWSVAIDGDRMVVGAPGDDTKGSNAGAVYVFEKSGDTWSQTRKLLAADGETPDTFGWSVGVSGNRISVGAPGTTEGGTIYWYTGSGDTWQSVPADAPEYNSPSALGRALDTDGSRIVAGDPYNDRGEEDAGTAVLLEFMYCAGEAATMVGSSGADNLIGTPGPDVIVGLAGDDLIDGKAGHDIVCAGPGNDELRGKDGNDKLYGEGGNDKLNGAAGDDVVDGGGGKDTAVYFGASAGVTVDLGTGVGGGADQGSDTINRIEHVMGSSFADVLRGDAGGNRLKGLAGADELRGMGGIDTLIGAANNDLIYGGSGNDILQGKAGLDTIYGGSGLDMIEGNNGNDTLYGDADDDTLRGGPGEDLLDGGTGTDTLNGGADDDACTRGPFYQLCELIL